MSTVHRSKQCGYLTFNLHFFKGYDEALIAALTKFQYVIYINQQIQLCNHKVGILVFTHSVL